jgi:antitoxin VapB
MNIVKLSKNNEHQFVDLPQPYQLEGEEAYIKKVGNVILLIPKDNPWQTLFSSLELFSDDFMEQREQPSQPEREELFE